MKMTFSPRPSPLAPRPSARGVALIITLIMLSVITFMTVTFLVLSHRERGAVVTTTDQTTARFAADSALERVKREILAPMLAFTNDQAYDLMVSTNFINLAGLDPAAADYRTNVNYTYTLSTPRRLLNTDQLRQNIANLQLDPRPPVFIVTNRLFPTNTDFRFYLDLNRNGRYEPNGLSPVLSPFAATPYVNTTDGSLMSKPQDFVTLSNSFVGDPEWIGVLEYPDQPHSASNKFLARYAFLVVPAGKALDVNYLHNAAALNTGIPFAYRRNMGVGTWEINLAALLADLNTNYWLPYAANDANAPTYYQYLPLQPQNGRAAGHAFEDAQSLLNYRYNGNYKNLHSLQQLFPNNAAPFAVDYVDEFGGGGVLSSFLSGTRLPTDDGDSLARIGSKGWPGDDNPNHFFTPQDFFDRSKINGVGAFVDALLAAGATNSSYDRHTFYRMLAQLGTDSAPEENKMNLNYLNLDVNGNVVPGMETNLIRWQPLAFFTNAANRLLLAYSSEWLSQNHSNYFGTYGTPNAFGVTNIPVLMSGFFVETNVASDGTTYRYVHYVTNCFAYTATIQRILQLAANLYEATTNTLYPCVYRPIFRVETTPQWTNIYIAGFKLVNGSDSLPTPLADLTIPYDLNNPVDRVQAIKEFGLPNPPNIYGVPWIIGARKGFPNLNEVLVQSTAQITRKLQITRPKTTAPYVDYDTSQMLIIGVSNNVGVEVWNSYATNYPRAAYIQADGGLLVILTNDVGLPLLSTNLAIGGYNNLATNLGAINLAANDWRGTGWNPGQGAKTVEPESFKVPLLTNVVFLPDSVFQQRPFNRLSPVLPGFSEDWSAIQTNYFPQPHWGLSINSHIRCFILDGGLPGQGRVVDYVHLAGMNAFRDLGGEMYTNTPGPAIDNMWSTNPASFFLGTNSVGIMNQIYVSMGQPASSDADWSDRMLGAPTGAKKEWEIDSFRKFMKLSPLYDRSVVNTQLVAQAPFTPTSKKFQLLRLQANDPLVHFTVDDLRNLAAPSNLVYSLKTSQVVPQAQSNFWRYTERYEPWGGSPTLGLASSPLSATNLALKDPLVRASDEWDFPTNKFPNIGWMGRVHRGTPWQTVYMKSGSINSNLWTQWTGNGGFRQYRTESYKWLNGGWSPLLPPPNIVTNATGMDFTNSMPAQDRLAFDPFTTAVNDNAARGRLSINQTNLAAWSAVLSGVIAVTNSSTTNDLAAIPPVLRYEPLLIQPAGTYNPALPLAEQPPLVQIVSSINLARANTNAATGPVFTNHVFNHLGDILAAPLLTQQSPYLNPANAYGIHYLTAGGINDAAMERIPQQIMGLLTLSHSPRFVVYSYGQALKPAERSIVMNSGPYFGLCTNYQVTAEVATRAVVRVEGSPDPAIANNPDPGRRYPPRLVVEQFNVLPPD
jgi:hypothetical protein